MINSRDIDDLHPEVRWRAHAHRQACSRVGIEIILTSTYRDSESQAALYAIGRTVKGSGVIPVVRPMGRIVTNAKPGESWHNWRVAYDVVIVRNGKAVWDTNDPAWKVVGELGEECGLEWAGRWTGKLREMAHFQYTEGLTLADFRAGKTLSKT